MIFVYRSHYEGPLSQRVRRLPDATVLAWFQRGWTCDDPWGWVEAELAQPAMHCSAAFGYQQWYLFDDGWASHHPHLAQSLLRYANHWDPLDD